MKALIKHESFEKGLVKQHVVNDIKVQLWYQNYVYFHVTQYIFFCHSFNCTVCNEGIGENHALNDIKGFWNLSI